MPLLIAVLISWLFIIVFALIPKRLNFVEFIFSYFVTTIIITSTFTLMDINLHKVVIDKRPEYAFAIIIIRTILFPTVFMVSVNGVWAPFGPVRKFGVGIFPFFVILGTHWAFKAMGVLKLQGLSVWFLFALILLFTGAIHVLSWGFTKLRVAGGATQF